MRSRCGWKSLMLCWLGLAGCASVPEKALQARHRETYDAVYASSNSVNAAVTFDGNARFDVYFRHAFARSSMVRAAFDRWNAALERIPQARSLEDPAFSFEYLLEQRDLRYQASLTQMLPGFGKLGLREKRAVAEAKAAMHDFEAMRFMLYDQVSKAFYEYHYLSHATEVTDENLRLLSDIEGAVSTRYKAGMAPFSELVKVQVEKDRLANELATLRDERGPKSAILAALLNLPAHPVLAWPAVVPSAPAIVDEAVLAEMIDDLNPELKAADAMIAADAYREQLSRRSFLPDFMLGASWMVMPAAGGKGNESDASIMAGITVPLWRGKHRAETRETAAMVRAAFNERTDRHNMLKAELSMAIFKFRDAERRVALFSTSLIPRAAQALEVARQELSTGKTALMTLIDAQRVLLEFKLLAERAAADREIANAEIGCCIGKYNNGR